MRKTIIQPTDFFTGDTHFWHRTVLKPEYGNRPFDDVEDMNAYLVHAWNSRVPPDGTVWHFGDVSFGNRTRTRAILEALNGTIHLIRGNHDRDIRGGIAARFASVQDYLEAKTPDGIKVVLCHYAMLTWNRAHHGSWMLHGHSHGNLHDAGIRRLDVGVDTHPEFAPWSFAELCERMDGRSFIQVDHHGEHLRDDQ
jgi:calcineurin-like phosphoesterase family protein